LFSSDLVIATGAARTVKLAQSSGKPTYGVGAGNPTVVIDETANVRGAARNCQLSKSSDNGSGCSAESNLIVEASIHEELVNELQLHAGYLLNEDEKRLLQKVYWDEDGHRTIETIARSACEVAELAGFKIPSDKRFLIAREQDISAKNPFCSEKLGCVLSLFKYTDFDMAVDMVQQLLRIGGKGHSCGIYSFDDEHIHRLALACPVSRIMVRQPHSTSNAGSFTNGMPMTSSLGCGVWGGNVTNENISMKHYLNVTWVSRPIPEDRPSDEELFGEFYNSEIF
jgi:sulfoacetaldehyde dehydrogenase